MAPSSSVGSDVFAILALLSISTTVTLLLRYYLPLRATPAYLLIPVFLALALPSSIVLLVPIDLASSSGTDTDGQRGIWLPDNVMLVAWRLAYWLTFVLTWFVLPLLGEYCDSGYREPKDRFIYSLRSNARYQLITLSVGTAGAVYFFWQNRNDNTTNKAETLKALVMAMAYAYGLILAIYLMGHGLVAIPRRLIRDASVSARLKRLQSHAPGIHEKLDEAVDNLQQVEAQILQLRQRKNTMPKDLQEWVEELYDTSSLPESRPSVSSATAPPPVVTERYLAELSRKVKRARHKRARFTGEWNYLVRQAARLQSLLDLSSSQRPKAANMRYHVQVHILPALRVILGVFLACASVGLLWSEVVHEMDSKLSLVGKSVVHHPSSSRGQIGFAGQMISAAWLLYMCAAALYSVTEVKVWGNRALVRRQTYAESACWYSLQVAKLTVPLSFNFITMIDPTISEGTTFYRFLGRLINLTPVIGNFSAYFPIVVMLPVVATIFNLYGKIKNVIGFGVLEDEHDEPGTGTWREGRILIERELQADGSQLHLASSSLLSSAEPSPRHSADLNRPSRLTNNSRASAARRAAVRMPQEDEDTSERAFFQDVGQRVRNTFDTVEAPAWLKDIGDGIKKPKWMNGGDDAGSSSGDGGNFFGKLFGGGGGSGNNGNIRL
ncbi:hypothetical protein AUEXF2481DRAFT_6346 [Aureobasidium subglaciale EXF-2481]|uniref:Uncharacterized protein n=1 Tax=Aureobasidium subglaciale (strain EXF-2481) TaxID=1043005 RepID=A0A074Y7U1_AURSE|nr:uncharacterized protein AUEXF2481DRAFT_6346 [Aureobasidium subglaciale EXF-2481]KAI5208911.1 hypothetical protein E4T38_02602 [Aureobasidium subglaciale]KAI5227586.1 hypothetical protein E4T40_02574 [Aureobasidium subglaciale]KAI5231076.1 hypothetical protein E4T41_02601 [Aureobasidium subglaciale]KAI5265173.1 hypothetical protein E4T46_02379 [Aureobasidium subglaciale]KEQ93760.1 hypothetical protein AUEXF2481DRAFT_6346 [Aureobasidium subglaciale EXF-2481]